MDERQNKMIKRNERNETLFLDNISLTKEPDVNSVIPAIIFSHHYGFWFADYFTSWEEFEKELRNILMRDRAIYNCIVNRQRRFQIQSDIGMPITSLEYIIEWLRRFYDFIRVNDLDMSFMDRAEESAVQDIIQQAKEWN